MCAPAAVVPLLGSSMAVVSSCGHTHFRREEQKQPSSYEYLLTSSAAPSARHCTVCIFYCWRLSGCVFVATDRNRQAHSSYCCNLCVKLPTVQSQYFFRVCCCSFSREPVDDVLAFPTAPPCHREVACRMIAVAMTPYTYISQVKASRG